MDRRGRESSLKWGVRYESKRGGGKLRRGERTFNVFSFFQLNDENANSGKGEVTSFVVICLLAKAELAAPLHVAIQVVNHFGLSFVIGVVVVVVGSTFSTVMYSTVMMGGWKFSGCLEGELINKRKEKCL